MLKPRHDRVQLALFTTNGGMFALLQALAGQIENATHLPRLADVPHVQSEDMVAANTQRMLRNFVLPFAIVAVTGTEEEIQHAALVFRAARKHVPTMLIMCPLGYRHLKETFDVPFSAMGNGRESHDIVGSVLLGPEENFPAFEPDRFGEATHLPPEQWQKVNLEYLAEYVRRVAKAAPRRVTC